MSNVKLTDLSVLTTPASGDLMHVVDVSDTSQSADGTSKKITYANLTSTFLTSSDLSSHTSATVAHGTTGDVVGTSDTQTLTNKTLTSPRLNENVALTATSTELNTLDGYTGTVSDLNYAKELNATGVTATEFDSLDGITATASELNITDNGQTTEKVLNVQCKCRVYLNAAQLNITNSTATKVLLDTENYDVGSDFDTANSRFVAPVDGYYLVAAQVGYTGFAADSRCSTEIYVNGSRYSFGWESNGLATTVRNHFSDIVYCGAGQYIELYTTQITGASTTDLISASESTFMAIHLLSI